MSLKELTAKLLRKENLTADECESAIESILTFDKAADNAIQTACQISGFLIALRAKGETGDEVFGIVRGMQKHSQNFKVDGPSVDIVGTGGDGYHTVNISTGASIILAACGVKVAKHGNRSVSSLCGSADVLETLGVKLQLSAEEVNRCVEELGIGFCFAPVFHPAMASVREMRRSIGLPTVFNLIGPLLNPAGAKHHLIGVCDKALLPVFIDVLRAKGAGRSWVFLSEGGLDELAPVGRIFVSELQEDGEVREFEIDFAELGIPKCEISDLAGGDPQVNAQLLVDNLGETGSAINHVFALNAAAGLLVCGEVASLKEGLVRAREVMASGKAKQLVEEWVALSNDKLRLGGASEASTEDEEAATPIKCCM